MEGNDVRLAKEFFRGDVSAELGGIGMGGRVVGEDLAAETGEVFDDRATDGARTEDADGLFAQFETLQPLQLKVSLPDAVTGPVDFPGHGEKDGEGELRDSMRGVGGDGGNGDAQIFGGGEIDMIRSGAKSGDEFGPSLGKDLEAGAVHLIVHKDQGGVVAGTEGSCRGVQIGFEKFELMMTGGVFRIQSGFRVPP